MSIREYWIPGVPSPDDELGRARAERAVCGEHGCIGPFVNLSYELGLGAGSAFGDCMECGRRGLIRPRHRGFEGIGQLVEAIIPPPAIPRDKAS